MRGRVTEREREEGMKEGGQGTGEGGREED